MPDDTFITVVISALLYVALYTCRLKYSFLILLIVTFTAANEAILQIILPNQAEDAMWAIGVAFNAGIMLILIFPAILVKAIVIHNSKARELIR
jgi:hypothetical protein